MAGCEREDGVMGVAELRSPAPVSPSVSVNDWKALFRRLRLVRVRVGATCTQQTYILQPVPTATDLGRQETQLEAGAELGCGPRPAARLLVQVRAPHPAPCHRLVGDVSTGLARLPAHQARETAGLCNLFYS